LGGQHVYQPSPNEAPYGSNYSLYGDEFFTDPPIVGPLVIPNCSLTDDPALPFQGATINGAVVVHDRLIGKLRIHVKPNAQVIILNETVPSELGPTFSCWGATITAAQTSEAPMIPNKLYPFQIYYRSGCEYIDQWVKLEWMLADSTSWVDVPQDNLRVPNAGQTCLERYFGDNCDQYCDADCNMHGDCVLVDGVPTCQCFPGYTGDHCENPARAQWPMFVFLLEDGGAKTGWATTSVLAGVVGFAAVCAAAIGGLMIWRQKRNAVAV
jgi:hypothetical protein